MKSGDIIATIAQPIAKSVDRLLGTDIQNCSKCKQMQNSLNNGMSLTDAIYERFLGKNNKTKDTKMQYIIIKQVVVDAETPEEALTKINEAVTVSITIQARPQPVQPTK